MPCLPSRSCPETRRSLLGAVVVAIAVSVFGRASLPVCLGALRARSLGGWYRRVINHGGTRLAQARAAYHPGDWDATYRVAVRICEFRECLTLARTRADRAEVLPETDVLERELGAHLNEAAQLARTPSQRRAVRNLDLRAFRGLQLSNGSES